MHCSFSKIQCCIVKRGTWEQHIAADIVHIWSAVFPTILRFALPSSERDRPAAAAAAVVKRDKRSMSASSEESMGSWSHITPEDDPHEETSSFIQLSEGSVTVAPCYCSKRCYSHPHPHSHWPIATDTCARLCRCQFTPRCCNLHA